MLWKTEVPEHVLLFYHCWGVRQPKAIPCFEVKCSEWRGSSRFVCLPQPSWHLTPRSWDARFPTGLRGTSRSEGRRARAAAGSVFGGGCFCNFWEHGAALCLQPSISAYVHWSHWCYSCCTQQQANSAPGFCEVAVGLKYLSSLFLARQM